MDMDEDAETCARRELEEETGLKVVNFEQLYAFSDVDRDPRYRVVSIAYYALVRWEDCKVKAGDDADRAQISFVRNTAPGIRSSTNSANGCRPIKVKSPVSADRDRSVAP